MLCGCCYLYLKKKNNHHETLLGLQGFIHLWKKKKKKKKKKRKKVLKVDNYWIYVTSLALKVEK